MCVKICEVWRCVFVSVCVGGGGGGGGVGLKPGIYILSI